MRALVRYVIASVTLWIATPLQGQQQAAAGPPLPPLSAEAAAALEELAPRYASEAALIQGWFRDRTVLYYDFGSVPSGVKPGRVLWPIHGFDARGNPVAIRGQRPIFSTLPGLGDYSGIWHLVYVVTADNAQPNKLRDVASVEAAVRRRKASLRATELLFNLPIVPRGTRLARDTTTGMAGWYEGRDIEFFDFGQASTSLASMWRFIRGVDTSGEPIMVTEQHGILDSIPVSPTYPDLWEIHFVRVDSTYQANSIKSAAALRSARVAIDSATIIRNLPVTIVDGAMIPRTRSPLRTFADLRSPFPPKPTPPQ